MSVFGNEFEARLQEALRLEKIKLKSKLREDIKRGRTAQVFQYCAGQSTNARAAMRDLLTYGHTIHSATEADAKWALRYYRRLMGRPAK